MQALLKPLKELAEYEIIEQKSKKETGIFQVSGCVSSQKSHFICALGQHTEKKLVVAAGELMAEQLRTEIGFLEKNVLLYPSKDLLFYQADLRSKDLLAQRMQVIKAILSQEEVTVVAGFDALFDGLVPLDYIRGQILQIRSGDVIDLDQIRAHLVQCGYERMEQAEAPGCFAIRGGILDIYTLTEEMPVRIELWGDEVDSIRFFDPATQRSVETISEVMIYPATDFPGEECVRVSFLDYFSPQDSMIFFDEPARALEQGHALHAEFLEAQTKRAESGVEFQTADLTLFEIRDVTEKLASFFCLALSTLDMRAKELRPKEMFTIQTKDVNPYNNSFEMLTRDLKKYKRNGYRVVLLSGSHTRAQRLAEDLRDYNLSAFYSEVPDREVAEGEIMVTYGHVTCGYEYPLLKFMVIAESDIFGKVKKKKKRKNYEGQHIQSFTELKPGDYVVHENHGLGIYQGIEPMTVDRISKDYVKILYAGGSNLYIPATQMDLIQKYASADTRPPKLNSLGNPEWTKTKNRVRGAVQEIAKDLVELYARRQKASGYEYGPDTVWQKEFEEMFPFEETDDQLAAIESTKRDMESRKIMDRLICGDVGYGKTEIAIRAAFKAVQESKQVVYLVPTTVLAQQHYNTFMQRMKDFPIRVDLLCRFRTQAQQQKTIRDLKQGLVDIVIGTHRVLSKDVVYKDLGLLIIDEEQRFGVRHKEQIKKLKSNVDVLSLSATPIPRTLHMSLIGIRDMSVLEEAPNDRMPIQTYVMEYNDEMVREAIERELSRDGQVYYVYNRVNDIDEMTARIRKLVPDANIAYAHGQMPEQHLEQIMLDFVNGEIDVLVSTTIIETGLDISNANTMIIHDADRLGLSQLYQLRGRVGRSNRMAYAFLLYRRDKLLREEAEKRLAAIREFTDLGSGFKIAMRDLEIRGAGNLLGDRQHGHMEAVGYDLYCKMLNQAVRYLKGESEEEDYTTTIDLNVAAYIPPSYISDEYQKLDIYKRIAAIETQDDLENMTEELIDRYGDIPKTVYQLLQIALLKASAHALYVTAVEQKGDTYRFAMYEKARVRGEMIPELLQAYGGDLRFQTEGVPAFFYRKNGRKGVQKDEIVLETVKNVLNGIKTLLE